MQKAPNFRNVMKCPTTASPGASRSSDCSRATPIKGDDLRHTVAWKDESLEQLPAGRYKLRLHLNNAEVFAVTFIGN